MALVRKGSRTITVDGRAYRWRVRRRPTYDQACLGGRLIVAVESAEARGSVLVVRTPYPHPSGVLRGEAPVPVTPGMVAGTVRAALAAGWRPGRAGPPFSFALPDEVLN
ncbi:hypothetical protein O4J56_23475 [Nocardiopsis sp. RSe5-2]|uniref:ASCH domain-containing protein n=1 Tax=Nocardiopsis endophytica TaxID=3018445 RepID=A0ABT4U9J5_9ACTN|nr:hypothetical protein [Nocardiopsis endophytica]MDA2813625.1 hypothetical protein [Nocardiopsis endophytica]